MALVLKRISLDGDRHGLGGDGIGVDGDESGDGSDPDGHGFGVDCIKIGHFAQSWAFFLQILQNFEIMGKQNNQYRI